MGRVVSQKSSLEERHDGALLVPVVITLALVSGAASLRGDAGFDTTVTTQISCGARSTC